MKKLFMKFVHARSGPRRPLLDSSSRKHVLIRRTLPFVGEAFTFSKARCVSRGRRGEVIISSFECHRCEMDRQIWPETSLQKMCLMSRIRVLMLRLLLLLLKYCLTARLGLW
jgi:hypothetical protein